MQTLSQPQRFHPRYHRHSSGLYAPTRQFDPSIITWHSYYWASDPLWTPPSDGAATSSIRDGSGNALDLTGTLTARPTYRASVTALNNRPGLEFDGSNDTMVTSSYTNVTSTRSFVVIHAIVSAADNKYFLSSNGGGLRTYNSSGFKYGLQCGVSLNTTLVANTTGALVVGYLSNTTTSLIEKDGTSSATGDAGALGQTITHLGSFDGTQAYTSTRIAFAGIYTGGDIRSDPQWNRFKFSAAKFYGLTVV